MSGAPQMERRKTEVALWARIHVGKCQFRLSPFGLSPFGRLRYMPVSLLIDRSRKIALSHEGVVDKDSFESRIQELLQ